MIDHGARQRSADRLEAAAAFRERLAEVIDASGLGRTAFARAIGTDRSTLSQLLADDATRLPRAETIAAIARFTQVSADWLLGLTRTGQLGTDIIDEAVAIEQEAASPADERLRRWQTEAAGYKIRYVPTTLPDLLKTEAVIRYEHRAPTTLPAAGRIEQAEERLAYSRRPGTDIEACSPVQSLEEFARGTGVWSRLDRDQRREQLRTIVDRVDELYPTFRWFLYDGLERFSVPLTVFGPLRTAIYVGDMWLVLNATQHVQAFTAHFDALIRAAVVQPTEVADRVRAMI